MDRMTVLMICMGLFMVVESSDPDLLTDFDLPPNVDAKKLDGNFFTFTGFKDLLGPNKYNNGTVKVAQASTAEFPALSGQGLSYAFFQFDPNSVVPPHTHPRGSELLLVLEGSITVGFLDTANKHFTQALQKGDVFLFPKGLVHYAINVNNYGYARAIAAFSSVNPGTVVLPFTLFGTGISDLVLKNSFKISPQTLADLRAPFKRN